MGFSLITIVTLNVNGIRSALQKGLARWLDTRRADIVCLQEMRVPAEKVGEDIQTIASLQGYHSYAIKKGYSGVSIYSHLPIQGVFDRMGVVEFDQEGRYLAVDFGPFLLISVYFPSGSSGPVRQAAKYRFLAAFDQLLAKMVRQYDNILICGDINIAHCPIDLTHWRANQKNSGFLPQERIWLSEFLCKFQFVDVHRLLTPQDIVYTWWSNRGRAWLNNVGWRIDYHLATATLARCARSVAVYTEQRFSDHAPVLIGYDFARL